MMNRRDALGWLSAGVGMGVGVGAGGLKFVDGELRAAQPPAPADAPTQAKTEDEGASTAPHGLPRVTIQDVKTILTAPNRIRLVIVKVLTSEPGLYGIGCATFTQRARAVETAVEKYLRPFLIGRDVDQIEDVWQSSYVSSYWRDGPVLNNAMSGIDMALWDIKGKRAHMPVYQLLGGKCRRAADVYAHVQGRDPHEVEDHARAALARGHRHLRIQMAVPGMATYGARRAHEPKARGDDGPTGPRLVWEPGAYLRAVPKLFEHLRVALGEEVELLHDVHERIAPSQAVQFCKDLEKYRLFFLEDPVSPEDIDHFAILRRQTTIPLAMGELFHSRHEYVPLITQRLIDYIRIHVSQIGGLSMARKVAALCEFFGVRTAWHGPGDASPVAHAAQLALELATPNFGIHEGGEFPERTREVFPGCPEIKDGAMNAHEAPGLGIDIDEKLAARFPISDDPPFDYRWGTTRRRDGSVIQP